MPPKFKFYEVVTVIGDDPALEEIKGREGVVMGMSENELSGIWSYAVSIDEINWHILEEFLETTGRHMRREDFYTGESIRVRVTEDGRGEVIPEDERDYDA